jgi:hypothetical protein
MSADSGFSSIEDLEIDESISETSHDPPSDARLHTGSIVISFIVAILATFWKWQTAVWLPLLAWPSWIGTFIKFMGGYFSTLIRSVGNLPDLDLQARIVIDGIVPWLMFPIFWRYFIVHSGFHGSLKE